MIISFPASFISTKDPSANENSRTIKFGIRIPKLFPHFLITVSIATPLQNIYYVYTFVKYFFRVAVGSYESPQIAA
jgi:hypothetical protein